MANAMNVNPTRMELTRLKKRLHTAQRGHKLLKDKRDELMKQFLEIVKVNKTLRENVEAGLSRAYGGFSMARAEMGAPALSEALELPSKTLSVSVASKNIMSVDVPVFSLTSSEEGDMYPYGFAFTSGELDDALVSLMAVSEELLRLAEAEKTAQLLAQEIESTRRRVNALEHFMIPQLEETIKYITMKLDENERGNTTRLMKLKDMLIADRIEKNKKATE